ncbi:hypothetical protein [Evansella cellulosilytica]|uniref:Uncharacterized protein n=1 Tax=Evansella cellulosilytica (strain ATCC 21833 / DSM 2522 / FERM P-1141 / JCM 9156 / N-4) TaxID=649639 RepID=E6U055_EVAC2|nr:hypothetical protein [Evansella cellulosilytica]ADU29059.1 hypothetical protein Bcell_0778 [Evansella cellulosilytica DSM 2522]
MIHPIFELTEWLESHKGTTMTIEKQELETGTNEVFDHDRAQLQLNEISVRNLKKHDEDDYLADQELILHGEGNIHTDQGEMELPQNAYEIPILGEVKTENSENGMKVTTGKAIYTITLQ